MNLYTSRDLTSSTLSDLLSRGHSAKAESLLKRVITDTPPVEVLASREQWAALGELFNPKFKARYRRIVAFLDQHLARLEKGQKHVAEEKEKADKPATPLKSITASSQEGLDQELRRLISDLRNLGFRESAEVSHYIAANKIGYRYPSICGSVTFGSDESEWELDGGFAPEVFAQICIELGVRHRSSHARVIRFKAYKDL